MTTNPFDLAPGEEPAPKRVKARAPDPTLETFRDDFGLSGVPRQRIERPGFQDWSGGLICAPGAYRDVPISVYHGPECCDTPSISSTGLKRMAGDKGARTKGRTPRHFWESSSLNPNRKPTKDTDALRLGRAFHDALLLPEVYERDYHFTPEGFSRAAKVKMAEEIAAADAAIAAGLSTISASEAAIVAAMVAAMRADELIAPLLVDGEAEVTLVWKDKETGVMLRARPDWMLPDLSVGMNMKTDADASYDGFSKSIGKFGYAQSVALELDGYEAVFGEAPRKYLHPVVEKPAKESFEPGDFIATALWEMPFEDIERGRWLNRMAIQTFADCLSSGKWPGYTPEVELCGMPGYLRHVIDEGGAAEPANDEIKGS